MTGAAAAASTPAADGAPPSDDGPGEYELVGFISHLGKNTGSGHYVCHIKKEGKWALFNDRKVSAAAAPSAHAPIALTPCRALAHATFARARLICAVTHCTPQVAESKNPPRDEGYLYLFQRCS